MRRQWRQDFLPPLLFVNYENGFSHMVIRRLISLALLFPLFGIIVSLSPAGAEEEDTPAISEALSLIDNGGFGVTGSGDLIAAHNLHTGFVPASIIKIATSLAALRMLGPDYRFATDFFLDDRQNLYIKGYGDPYLISEETVIIAKEIKSLGCDRLNDIYLDDSAFDLKTPADGAGTSDNPYDALNSGLAVNFNTINLRKDASDRVFSAEDQTPTLPLMAELAENLAPGIHRINITRDRNRQDLMTSRYVGELFRAVLQSENIAVAGTVARRKTPEGLAPYYQHRSSRPLKEIIPHLMRHSNNFIANQLFLAVGVKKFGYPASWRKSREALAEILQQDFHIPAGAVRLVEGSGLSRKNSVTPSAMLRLLDLFKPYSGFLPEEEGILLKSGTLQGVYAFAGYFSDGSNLDGFVLILNQDRNTRKKLLQALERIYYGSRIRTVN